MNTNSAAFAVGFDGLASNLADLRTSLCCYNTSLFDMTHLIVFITRNECRKIYVQIMDYLFGIVFSDICGCE